MGAAEQLDRLTIVEACDYLTRTGYRITPKTMRNLLWKKMGPAREECGGRIYFRTVDLDAWRNHRTRRIEAYE